MSVMEIARPPHERPEQVAQLVWKEAKQHLSVAGRSAAAINATI